METVKTRKQGNATVVTLASNLSPAQSDTPAQLTNNTSLFDDAPSIPPLYALDITLLVKHLQFTGGDLNAFIHSLGAAGLYTTKVKIKSNSIYDKLFGKIMSSVGKHFGVDASSDDIDKMKDLINKGFKYRYL